MKTVKHSSNSVKAVIDNSKDLESLIEQATAAKSVAVDTEFVWERTYYPNLGTVQLGLNESSVYLVDVLAIPDLTVLGQLLSNPAVMKILHDAQQDLMILARATGSYPKNVFDTRCAAGFAGLNSTISLGALLNELLGINLPKSETRADWLRRPLPDQQLEYALDDVRYLPAAYEIILERVREADLERWLSLEMQEYDDPDLYQPNDPQQQYSRVKGAGGLRPQELGILRELADWREQKARTLNRPKTWVIPDKTLITVSRTKPQTIEELSLLQILSDGQLRKYARDFIDAVHSGLKTESSQLPVLHNGRLGGGPYHQKASCMLSAIKDAGYSRGVDPPLVASRREIEALLRDGANASPSQHRLLRGWRKEFLDNHVPEFKSL